MYRAPVLDDEPAIKWHAEERSFSRSVLRNGQTVRIGVSR